MLDMARGVSQVAPVGAAGHIQDTPQGLAGKTRIHATGGRFTENGFRVLYMFQYLAGYDQIKTLVSVGELLCVLDLERGQGSGACLLHYPTGEIGTEVGVRSCRLQNGLSEFTFPASDLRDGLNIARETSLWRSHKRSSSHEQLDSGSRIYPCDSRNESSFSPTILPPSIPIPELQSVALLPSPGVEEIGFSSIGGTNIRGFFLHPLARGDHSANSVLLQLRILDSEEEQILSINHFLVSVLCGSKWDDSVTSFLSCSLP